MAVTISAPDALRQSVEAATGGRNTVLYDDKGYPSVMVVIPRFTIEDIDAGLGTGTHPAFIVDGRTKSEMFVGKYPARVHDNRALALPGQDPTTTLDWGQANDRCAAKGPGWHLMTNAEWAAVALWSWKNATMPSGNTDWGRDHERTHETGRRADGHAPGSPSGHGRTLTGSGPARWCHDGTAAGLADLCGNVWEWVRGLRLVDGEIQIVADNDAAVTAADHSPDSPLWRAVLQDGSLVAPGTADTLKWDATGSAGSGSPILDTAIASQSDGTSSASRQYKDLTAAEGVTPPPLLKRLGLYPHATDMDRGRLFLRNVGEQWPRRGGGFSNVVDGGLFSLYMNTSAAYSASHVGFRPAFAI